MQGGLDLIGIERLEAPHFGVDPARAYDLPGLAILHDEEVGFPPRFLRLAFKAPAGLVDPLPEKLSVPGQRREAE